MSTNTQSEPSNDQSLEFVMGGQGVPVGSYAVEFSGAEPYLENADKYGKGLILKRRVLEGEHEDAIASRIVSQKTGPKANLPKFISALKGSKVEAGERIVLDSLIGTKGTAVVEETDSGATRVAAFLKNV